MLVNMNDILLPAKEEHYGVGFFNAVNVEMARAVIETAEELRSPVMTGGAASSIWSAWKTCRRSDRSAGRRGPSRSLTGRPACAASRLQKRR